MTEELLRLMMLRNTGPISEHARNELESRGISVERPPRVSTSVPPTSPLTPRQYRTGMLGGKAQNFDKYPLSPISLYHRPGTSFAMRPGGNIELPVDPPLQPGLSPESPKSDIFSAKPTATPPLSQEAPPAPTTAPMPSERGGAELPYQTYQRLFGKSWGNAGGGRGDLIRALLDNYSIAAAPGSAEANLALQAKLKEQFKI